MSARQQIERAVRKAETRDRKRRRRMTVSGKSVLRLGQLIRSHRSKLK